MLLSVVPEEANVVAFPREGFIIGDHLCRCPGPNAHQMCFALDGHDGPHEWGDWRGCRVRIPGPTRTVPFGGFAY